MEITLIILLYFFSSYGKIWNTKMDIREDNKLFTVMMTSTYLSESSGMHGWGPRWVDLKYRHRANFHCIGVSSMYGRIYREFISTKPYETLTMQLSCKDFNFSLDTHKNVYAFQGWNFVWLHLTDIMTLILLFAFHKQLPIIWFDNFTLFLTGLAVIW